MILPSARKNAQCPASCICFLVYTQFSFGRMSCMCPVKKIILRSGCSAERTSKNKFQLCKLCGAQSVAGNFQAESTRQASIFPRHLCHLSTNYLSGLFIHSPVRLFAHKTADGGYVLPFRSAPSGAADPGLSCARSALAGRGHTRLDHLACAHR